MLKQKKFFNRIRLLKITQDSAAILFNDKSNDIDGIYTDDLKSCIAIVIKGEKGIALIHDSGKLSEKSIANIFELVSPIQSWSIAHYPQSDYEYQKFYIEAYKKIYDTKSIFQTKYERTYEIVKNFFGEEVAKKYSSPNNKAYYEANSHFVFIKGDFTINTTDTSVINDLQLSNNWEERDAINQLNCSCMQKDEYFDVDIQYDGCKYNNLPTLVYSLEEIKKFSIEDPVIKNRLDKYHMAIQNKLDKSGYVYYKSMNFFSPSKYATIKNPYGPYADHFCCPGDISTDLTMKLNCTR